MGFNGIDIILDNDVMIKHPEMARIGSHVAIDKGFYCTVELQIGDYVHIAPYCTVIGGKKSKLVMEDFSGFSAGCRIVCASDDYLGSGMTNPIVPLEFRGLTLYTTVTIKKHAVLGTGCVVHPGVTIGEGAVVGSMSLVTKDLEPWSVYMGIPAKKVKDRNKDIILDFEKKLRNG